MSMRWAKEGDEPYMEDEGVGKAGYWETSEKRAEKRGEKNQRL